MIVSLGHGKPYLECALIVYQNIRRLSPEVGEVNEAVLRAHLCLSAIMDELVLSVGHCSLPREAGQQGWLPVKYLGVGAELEQCHWFATLVLQCGKCSGAKSAGRTNGVGRRKLQHSGVGAGRD